MNKQKHGPDSDDDGLSPEKLIETMTDSGFTPEQLPALWQHYADQDLIPMSRARHDSWHDVIDNVYRRCETYPQHVEIAVVLSELPHSAWRRAGWLGDQINDLLKQAAPEQIQQALRHEQHHPAGWWAASPHILQRATVDQLTGPVIDQLQWEARIALCADDLPDLTMEQRRRRHIVNHIQQRLLGSDSEGAWAVFCGIANDGTRIGDIAELANAIEQQNRPSRNGT